ncbi:MAG: glycosyltransferase family 4 protein [Deltaproteobacteria bacterium]|jgi:glycosyltransferase involved in cell wall biosynthesis|nr:glycosyltransferase family 4 protein [Deltaproteobacteria bacterium]
MNILLMNLSPDFYEGELQTLFLAHALRQRDDCRLVILCHDGSPLQRFALTSGLESIAFVDGFMGKLAWNFKLHWFSKRNNKEKWIIHTHDDRSVCFGGKLAQKKTNFLLLHSRHSPARASDPRFEEKLRAAGIIACETQEIAYTIAEAKVPPKALKIIRGAIDRSRYTEKIPRNDNRLILICPGRLIAGNGHENLIRALSIFQQASWLPPWELRISGSGPLFSSLLTLAKELKVESHLAFLGGQDSNVVLPDCDVLIAPASQGEGCSLPVLEGWATGLPVICSDSLAHVEIVHDGQDALFFKQDSPEDLAAKMLALCREESLRASLAAGGTRSLSNFTCATMLEQYVGLYRRLLDE